MLISTKGRYALRVLIDMAEHSSQEYIKLSDIADRQEISEKYLESIVRQLVVNKIVTGLRGKVLRFMEGSLAPVACMEETNLPCPRVGECRTREFWRGLNDAIRRYTDSFTIADLARTDNTGYDYII